MTAKIGSLLIDIGANVAKVTSDMGKIQRNVKSSTSKITKAIGVVKTAAGAMFTGYALKAAVDYGSTIIDMADKFEELSITTGVSVENLSRLGYVAGQSKTDVTTLANGLRILGKNVDDTALGLGQAQTAFSRLGVTVKDSKGNLKDVDDLFSEIADGMLTLKSTTEQSAIAQKIFGKSGASLLPILNHGS